MPARTHPGCPYKLDGACGNLADAVRMREQQQRFFAHTHSKRQPHTYGGAHRLTHADSGAAGRHQRQCLRG